jgi:chromosome segregation ATPase
MPLRRPEADRAFGLIGEVLSVLPALVTKCTDLDATIAATRKRAKEELEKIAEAALQWQRGAESLKQQTAEMARATTDFERRAEAAEAEAQSLSSEAEKLKRSAIEAATFNTLFQQKIVSSFGAGTPGRIAIDKASPKAPSPT